MHLHNKVQKTFINQKIFISTSMSLYKMTQLESLSQYQGVLKFSVEPIHILLLIINPGNNTNTIAIDRTVPAFLEKNAFWHFGFTNNRTTEQKATHTIFYSSNWRQKSKIRVSYWWSCISLFAHVFSVKCIRSPTIHSPTWKLKQNKCTRKCSKKGNTTRKWWFKSNQFKRIHVLTSFCLASDPQRKTSVSHTGQFEKDRIRTSRCSGRKFPPHLPPGSDRCGRQSSI